MNKICSKCGQGKPLGEFYRGNSPWCKSCHAEYKHSRTAKQSRNYDSWVKRPENRRLRSKYQRYYKAKRDLARVRQEWGPLEKAHGAFMPPGEYRKKHRELEASVKKALALYARLKKEYLEAKRQARA